MKKVRTCYIKQITQTSIAIADLCDYYGLGKIITRINVPDRDGCRGKGYGSALLKEIISDADTSGTTLFLEVLPSGNLTYDQLVAWYSRHGFKPWKGIYRRKPKKE